MLGLAVAALCVVHATAITTKVEAGSEFCFREHVEKDVPMSFQFRVTAGGKLDVNVDVFDGSGRKLHNWEGATEGHYNVRGDASNTRFKFCFGNKMAKFTPKWVNFYTHKGVHSSVGRKEDVDPVEARILDLSAKMQDLRDTHDALRQEEKEHRATIEDANERVWMWSFMELFAMVLMGCVQVFFLKRFLEVRTSV